MRSTIFFESDYAMTCTRALKLSCLCCKMIFTVVSPNTFLHVGGVDTLVKEIGVKG